MAFCSFRLSAPAMLSSPMLPCHWFCPVSPPLAARVRLRGLPSIFRLPSARRRCCWRVPSRRAEILSMAVPPALMPLPERVRLSGAAGSGEALALKSSVCTCSASPRAKPRACPAKSASSLAKPSAVFFRLPLAVRRPLRPKPKRPKSGALMSSARVSPRLPNAPLVLMRLLPRRMAVSARLRCAFW